MIRSIAKIKRTVGEHDNLTLAENTVVKIGDVDFICATLWTDFANSNPMAMILAQHRMNDYRRIRVGPPDAPYANRLRPEHTVLWHKKSVEFIVDSLQEANNLGRKTVVATHHAPSFQSVPERFRGDDLNTAYATSLEPLIETLNPNYWIHGHIHDTQDYNIGDTNILTNPRGYHRIELNPNFDPNWKIEL